MADQELAQLLLTKLSLRDRLNSLDFAADQNVDHQKVVGAVKSLQSLGELITADQLEVKRLALTSEGELMVANGSHEFRVWHAVPEGDKVKQTDLMEKLTSVMGDKKVASLGFSKAMAKQWLAMDKEKMVCRKAAKVEDEVKMLLEAVKQAKGDQLTEPQKKELKSRKLIVEVVEKSYDVRKGAQFTLTIEKPETDLTAEMIAKGTWKSKTFKEYNFNAKGIPPERGHLHPLLKVREQFRQIFLEMGFEEMPTNNFVESSFWNFDVLFVPQAHPARDLQDTFYLSDPATSGQVPRDYLERVKAVHENGGDCGSVGYNYVWKETESQKNVLRTHTTAVSARMLYQAAQEFHRNGGTEFTPCKFFSIDRVFRNETLDATHLAEFNQIEGVVADRNLTLGHLMGLIKEFFAKLGINDIRFKPTYNPYTEPSMEMYSWHPQLKKWVEVGNSGVFRPEMLRPMGLPEDVNVLGWGLSLERPTMIKYGIDNIRDLIGHKVDLQMVYDNAVCILEPREHLKIEA